MKDVTHVTCYASGFHAKGILDSGKEGSLPVHDIRGAVSSPRVDVPGYFLIMGKKLKSDPDKRGSFLLLAEGENRSKDALIEELSDVAAKMHCRRIYVDWSKAGFCNDFKKVIKKTHCQACSAPFLEDLEYGAIMVREFLAANSVEANGEESILLFHLLRATTDSITNDPVFEALRYIVGGYLKYRPYAVPVSMNPAATTFYY
jgi:hypothetical protein